MYTPPPPLDDVARERHADSLAAHPLPVDRRILAKVVEQELKRKVERVQFISSGTFHKAFLITLCPPEDPTQSKNEDRTHGCAEVVIRLALPYMPSLKTLSEIGTMSYMRSTCPEMPIPTVYAYDSSANNVLNAEWILMSKAPGVPLSRIHSPYPRALLANLARLILTVSRLRFAAIGSIYIASSLKTSPFSPSPSPISHNPSLPLSHDLSLDSSSSHNPNQAYTVGPLISWPFFGSSRGLLAPALLNRGPWRTTDAYLESCSQREIGDVIRENEGRVKGRRPMRRPSTGSSDGDGSSGEEKLERGPDEVEEEEELSSSTESGEGLTDEDYEDTFYRDYRAAQRSTFLVAHTNTREASVRAEMGVALSVFGKLLNEWEQWMKERGGDPLAEGGDFGLDLHDLSRENVFVDENDHTKVTCIIDWESINTRPLWQTHHLPSFIDHHHHHHHHHGHGHHHHGHHPHSHGHHNPSSRPRSRTQSGSPSHSQSKLPTPNMSGVRSPLSPLALSRMPMTGFSPLTQIHEPQAHAQDNTPPINRPHPLSRTSTSYQSHHSHGHHHHHHHHHAQRMNEHTFLEEMAALPGGAEWIEIERQGRELRKAHRVFEWDGWEEGLVPSCLGLDSETEIDSKDHPPGMIPGMVGNVDPVNEAHPNGLGLDLVGEPVNGFEGKIKHLDTEGDMCGGVGGELGRRLEALVVNGFGSPSNGKDETLAETEDEGGSASEPEEGEEGPYYDAYTSSPEEGSSSSCEEEAGGAPDPGQVHFGFHNFHPSLSRTHSHFHPVRARTPLVPMGFLPLNGPPPGESTPKSQSTSYPSYPGPRSPSQVTRPTGPNGIPLSLRTNTSSFVTPSASTPNSSTPITPVYNGSTTRLHQLQHLYRDPRRIAPLAGPADSHGRTAFSRGSPSSDTGVAGQTHGNQGVPVNRAAQTKSRLAMFLAANGVGS